MTDPVDDPPDTPRRRFLRGAALAAGAFAGAGIAAPSTASSAKVSHKLAHYQQTPNGAAHCQVCSQFLPQPSCKVVDDPIVPTGWCLLYAAKTA